ncbi:MAG TPA: hypothetical protein PLV93_14060 [Microthrixaceae bacterium]|nr:hypothetical protein [Microthrixaceae bacterium]HNI36521.1 hypothetical protein [Microthrixaceae bacterium]
MSVTTKLTEIVTGLGMLGGDHPTRTLPALPGELRNVDPETWSQVVNAWDEPSHRVLVDSALTNGRFFADATDALRGRRPLSIEWTGPQRSPGDEVAPVDLRIDHVYLVSCKYLSKITVNASPSHLFDRLLTGGHGRRSADWYSEVAPAEHERLWARAREWLSDRQPDMVLSPSVGDLSKADRRAVGKLLSVDRQWPEELRPSYAALCAVVADRSATRWSESVADASSGAAESMLWRLLRIGSAPYFVLGVGSGVGAPPLRLRVASPWDWRQHYTFRRLDLGPLEGGQPMVEWAATLTDRSNAPIEVRGHVEIRWSHGRFSGPPEAKVYLDTPFTEVPGYWPLR